ncbi:MAG: histidine kinase [Bacteroidetes bacterium]|nr:MAG: histidine kinase [Bacteroidota bacterium]
MKKSIVVLLHVGFWLCYLLLAIIMVAVYYRSSGHGLDQTARIENAFKSILIFAVFPSIITFYLSYFLVFPKHLQQKKIFRSILLGLLISVGAAILGYVAIRYFIETGRLIDMDNGGKNGRSTAIGVIFVMTIIASISGMVALVMKGFITWYEEMKLKEELKQKNHETEMALLKAQLDPHFLFNTLNNIDVLLIKDATKASDYLNMLSDILRFMLYETKTDTILLEKEIEYIHKYIELQKIRTSNLNYVNFEVTGNPGNKMIAPMVYIPFIENAFKHSTNKKIDNAINVKVFINKDNILFICENKFDSSRMIKQDSGGLGNELIKKRLNLLYPDMHNLEIVNQSDNYSVLLTIQYG